MIPFRCFLERSRKFRLLSLFRQRERNSDLPCYDKDEITYSSDKRIDRFIAIIVTSIGTVMLIAPLWILQSIGGTNAKLVVITAFILVFLAILSVVTNAKQFETLGATAAYSAVLMVFLQLGRGAGG